MRLERPYSIANVIFFTMRVCRRGPAKYHGMVHRPPKDRYWTMAHPAGSDRGGPRSGGSPVPVIPSTGPSAIPPRIFGHRCRQRSVQRRWFPAAALGGHFRAAARGAVDDLVLVGQCGQSIDARIATASGHSHYINGEAGLAHLHRLRALVDAVVIGVGTAIADDPQLTVRRVAGPSPARVIIDPERSAAADRTRAGGRRHAPAGGHGRGPRSRSASRR